jgi:hypothetical protein
MKARQPARPRPRRGAWRAIGKSILSRTSIILPRGRHRHLPCDKQFAANCGWGRGDAQKVQLPSCGPLTGATHFSMHASTCGESVRAVGSCCRERDDDIFFERWSSGKSTRPIQFFESRGGNWGGKSFEKPVLPSLSYGTFESVAAPVRPSIIPGTQSHESGAAPVKRLFPEHKNR